MRHSLLLAALALAVQASRLRQEVADELVQASAAQSANTTSEQEPELALDAPEIDSLFQSFETEKFGKRYAEFSEKFKQDSEKDKADLEEINSKLQTVQQNANQGEMGFPFAMSKVPPLKKQLQEVTAQVLGQLAEAKKMDADVKAQDKDSLKKNKIDFQALTQVQGTVQELLSKV